MQYSGGLHTVAVVCRTGLIEIAIGLHLTGFGFGGFS